MPAMRNENLKEERLGLHYRRRLATMMKELEFWAHMSGYPPLKKVAKNPESANSILVDFVQYLYSQGQAFWKAPHTVLAMQTQYLGLRGQLKAAWDSVASWRLMRPVTSRTPMPKMILDGLICTAVLAATSWGKHEAELWWAFAVTLQVVFFALLRPKEIWGLKVDHVRVPGDLSFANADVAVLTILSPKNRAFMGRLQVRMVKDAEAIAWLRWLMLARKPG